MITDLTEGKPSKLLFRFSLPLLLSAVFQQLYTIADFIIAGKFIGVDALAAVGVSGMVTFLFFAFASGSNIGASVVIGQYYGAKKYAEMKTAVSTSIISLCALAVFFTIVGLIFAEPLLKAMNTVADILKPALVYLNIYIYGLIFLFLYNICTGVFSALGDSRTPFIFLVISSLSNIALDVIFVVTLGWGIAGVAWTTFICQGLASVLSFAALFFRLKKFEPEVKGRLYSFRMLKTISKLAVPSILQQSFVSVGNLLILSKVNTFSNEFVAAYSSAIKLNTFAINCCMTIGNAISSFTAQNIGAKKLERVSKGFRAGLLLAEGVVFIFIVVFNVFPSEVISLFLDTSQPELIENALAAGIDFIRIVTPFYTIMSLKITCDAVLRGSGAMAEFMAGTFTSLFLRVLFSYILGSAIGQVGIWWALPLGWVLPCVMSYVFYKTGTWKRLVKKPLIEEQII